MRKVPVLTASAVCGVAQVVVEPVKPLGSAEVHAARACGEKNTYITSGETSMSHGKSCISHEDNKYITRG